MKLAFPPRVFWQLRTQWLLVWPGASTCIHAGEQFLLYHQCRCQHSKTNKKKWCFAFIVKIVWPWEPLKMSSDFAKCSLGTTFPPMRTAALIISPSDFTWDPGYGFSLGQPGSRFFCPLMARLTTRPGSCCCSLCNNSSCPFWLSSVPIQTGNHQSLYS